MTVNVGKKNWDKENMRTISCRLRKEEAEKFRDYAGYLGTTPHALLSAYVKECLVLNDRVEPKMREESARLQNENALLKDKLALALHQLDAARDRARRAEAIVDEFLRRHDGRKQDGSL